VGGWVGEGAGAVGGWVGEGAGGWGVAVVLRGWTGWAAGQPAGAHALSCCGTVPAVQAFTDYQTGKLQNPEDDVWADEL